MNHDQPTTPPAAPAWLRSTCRRLRMAIHHDPLAHISTPSDAVRLADQLLTSTAIAHSGSRIWCSMATAPLASLIHTASPRGDAGGIPGSSTPPAPFTQPQPPTMRGIRFKYAATDHIPVRSCEPRSHVCERWTNCNGARSLRRW